MKGKQKIKESNLNERSIVKRKKIPASLRGSLKGKAKQFTRKEREGLWKETELTGILKGGKTSKKLIAEARQNTSWFDK